MNGSIATTAWLESEDTSPHVSRTRLGPLSQSVEEPDSNPGQSEFESLEGHS